MERKKVAILLPWLKMGGTNKVAIRFMAELVQFCDVTLILSQNVGELLDDIPEGVRVVIDEMIPFREMFKKDMKDFRIDYVLCDLIYYLKVKTGHDNIDNYRYIVERHPYIVEDKFDCAISYHGQSPERLLNLLYRIHSKKKAVWIHGEMSFSEDKCRRLQKYYHFVDHFFFVSKPTQKSFSKVISFDEAKATVYYNPIDKEEIIKKAQLSCIPQFSANYQNILTVGRISSEKGQDMIPAITRKLLDKGYVVRWYIIGDGNMRSKIEELIKKYDVSDRVIILGTQTNPYCFMKACTIYVQPSYTEGYSTTICEAGMLGKAIIGTKPSGGIRDQITDEEDGLIVDATVDGITEGIMELLNNTNIRRNFEENILKKNFEGKGEIKKFLNYLYN